MGDDPLNPPSSCIGTSRGLVYWSNTSGIRTLAIYNNGIATYPFTILASSDGSNKDFAVGMKLNSATYGAHFTSDHEDDGATKVTIR